MAKGIKFRRNKKALLEPVKEGEIVYAADTNEWGLGTTSGVTEWRKHDIKFKNFYTIHSQEPTNDFGQNGDYYFWKNEDNPQDSKLYRKIEGIWQEIHFPLSREEADELFLARDSVQNYDDLSMILTKDNSVVLPQDYISSNPQDILSKKEVENIFGYLLADGSVKMAEEFFPDDDLDVLTLGTIKEIDYRVPYENSVIFNGSLYEDPNGFLKIKKDGLRRPNSLPKIISSYNLGEIYWDDFRSLRGVNEYIIYSGELLKIDNSEPPVDLEWLRLNEPPSNGFNSDYCISQENDYIFYGARNDADVYNSRYVLGEISTQQQVSYFYPKHGELVGYGDYRMAHFSVQDDFILMLNRNDRVLEIYELSTSTLRKEITFIDDGSTLLPFQIFPYNGKIYFISPTSQDWQGEKVVKVVDLYGNLENTFQIDSNIWFDIYSFLMVNEKHIIISDEHSERVIMINKDDGTNKDFEIENFRSIPISKYIDLGNGKSLIGECIYDENDNKIEKISNDSLEIPKINSKSFLKSDYLGKIILIEKDYTFNILEDF